MKIRTSCYSCALRMPCEQFEAGLKVGAVSPCEKYLNETVEALAEKLHIWYLEATKMLKPESYNPNAQKAYADLTEEQRQIDRYIAKLILEEYQEK